MVIENPDIIQRITKQLYPTIAVNNGSTPSKVERAMRHAINVAWFSGNQELQESIFKIVIDKPPCVSQFVATLADTLSKDMY